MKSSKSSIAVFCLMLFVMAVETNAVSHPFMIVNESMYADLQARALQDPWKTWKANAVSDSSTINPSDSVTTKIDRMKDICSSGALAYILDPANRPKYVTRLKNALNYWTDIYNGRVSGDWKYEVPAGAAFFDCVLALDIIYNDLTVTERQSIENKLDLEAEWFWNNGQIWSWLLNKYGVEIIWALYQDDPRLGTAISNYKNQLSVEMTTSGIFTDGPQYAQARFAQNRNAKVYTMDVLEFTGKASFYNDPVIRRFYEWLFGYTVTPFGKAYGFGDTWPDRTFDGKGSPAFYRAYRFSPQIAKYAAWSNDGKTSSGSLLHYVLGTQTLPAMGNPTSKIFTDGGAWFLEDSLSDNSLAGALWNVMSAGYHARKETNAIHISAYGEHILRNVGYHWGTGPHTGNILGFSPSYSASAVAGNTVLINNVDHSTKVGSGITEGFTAINFDYASGYSGNALPNGKHRRNFVFIHPQDAKNGYFILFDEVRANTAGQPANVVLHPNSNSYTTVSANEEYKFTINNNPFTSNNAAVTIFLGTSPTTVNIKDGLLAGPNFIGKYLYSSYNTDSSGKKNIVTVLFPYDTTHAKGTLTRITGSSYTGASINLGNGVIDYALESSGGSIIDFNGVKFQGMATWYRTISDNITSYFVRSGRSFDDGKSTRQGFETDHTVSIYMKDKIGIVTADSSGEVKIYYPEISSVKIDGADAIILGSGTGWMNINIPSGIHNIALNGAIGHLPTCTDGIKNQGETDIDCGGSCPACTAPQTPCIDTCTSLKFQCGTQNICGVQTSCGTCNIPSVCNQIGKCRDPKDCIPCVLCRRFEIWKTVCIMVERFCTANNIPSSFCTEQKITCENKVDIVIARCHEISCEGRCT